MGDTFSAFIKFISDDPIMLGLCIAIIVLVILFILVLIIGKKKDNEKVKDNTAELLKTDINLDVLESTQQYSINDLKGLKEQTKDVNKNDVKPSLDNILNTQEKSDFVVPAVEIPVEVKKDDVSLEIHPISTGMTDTVTETFHDEPIEEFSSTPNNVFGAYDKSMANSSNGGFPTSEEFNLNDNSNQIIESSIEPIDDVSKMENLSSIPSLETQVDSVDSSSITESYVNPVEEEFYNGADSLINFNKSELENFGDIEKFTVEENDFKNDINVNNFKFEPRRESSFDKIQESYNSDEQKVLDKEIQVPINEVKKYEVPTFEPIEFVEDSFDKKTSQEQTGPVLESSKQMEPFSSIYLNTDTIELPEIKVDNFSKTAILRNLPIMESMPGLEDMNNTLPKPNESTDEDLEDIDLPKLSKSNSNSSVLSTLQGESFDIE